MGEVFLAHFALLYVTIDAFHNVILQWSPTKA